MGFTVDGDRVPVLADSCPRSLGPRSQTVRGLPSREVSLWRACKIQFNSCKDQKALPGRAGHLHGGAGTAEPAGVGPAPFGGG